MRNGGGGREVEAGVESGCVDNMISTLFVLNNNCTNYYENNGCLAAWPHAVLYLHSLGTSYVYLFRLAYCISLLRTDYVYWQAANTEPTHNMPLLSIQNYRRTLMLLSIGKAF